MTEEIIACLQSRRFSHVNEVELQDAIAEALEADGIGYEREVVLGDDPPRLSDLWLPTSITLMRAPRIRGGV